MQNPKLRSYYRYRRIANGILIGAVTVLGLLLALASLGYRHPFLAVLSYLAEAVLVASVADFIAIFALSQPIPGLKFTGLIQKKRKELIQGFVQACETRILPKQIILELVHDSDVVKILKQHFNGATVNEEAPALGKAIADLIRQECPIFAGSLARRLVAYLVQVDTELTLAKLEQLAKRKGWINAIIHRFFDTIAAEAQSDVFVDQLEMRIRRAVKNNRLSGSLIRRFWTSFKTWAGEKTDTINYRELAENLTETLCDVLANIGAEGSETDRWLKIEEFAGELVTNLVHNDTFIDMLQEWQAEVLTEERLAAQIEKMLRVLADWLRDGRLTSKEINDSLQFQFMNEQADDINISRWLAAIVLKGLDALEKNDAVVQEEFGKLAEAFVQKEYTSVLEIIRDVLSRLSDRGLVEKVHEVAGSNLQWLRISGAYIGLITGFLLFLVSTWPLYGLPILLLLTLAILLVKPFRKRLVVLSR